MYLTAALDISFVCTFVHTYLHRTLYRTCQVQLLDSRDPPQLDETTVLILLIALDLTYDT